MLAVYNYVSTVKYQKKVMYCCVLIVCSFLFKFIFQTFLFTILLINVFSYTFHRLKLKEIITQYQIVSFFFILLFFHAFPLEVSVFFQIGI